MKLNLWSVIHCTAAVLPIMINRSKARSSASALTRAVGEFARPSTARPREE